MMQFLRKHQRFFFVIITVVIIISFSFFGTYSAFVNNAMPNEVVFKTVTGKNVRQNDLEMMNRFIATDAYDKILFGGIWGPNFLNDGVIRQDFLESGMIRQIAPHFYESIRDDLETRLERESHYSPYVHPQMPFISAETVWGYYAPEIKKNLEIVRHSKGVLEPETFDAQVNLFVEERRFPGFYLSQVLQQQQAQFNWVAPDPQLNEKDLSLFGYHSFDDWFGKRTLQLISEVIINVASIAEEKGLSVSKQEAMADLLFQNEKSYQELQKALGARLGVKNSREYFDQQLKMLGMDQNNAVDVWQQVMLFRLMMNSVGDAVFIDTLPFEQFNTFAKEQALVDTYKMPPSLHFHDAKSTEDFQAYLQAISAKPLAMNSLEMPTQFKSIEEMHRTSPSLLQKRYLVDLSEVEVKQVSLKAPLRDIWDWEVQDDNWSLLVKQFPELDVLDASNADDRHVGLDSFDAITRKKVDDYARKAIVEKHPEWVLQSLQQAPIKKMELELSQNPDQSPLKGIQNVVELQKQLDRFSSNAESFRIWSDDKQTCYQIKVLDASKDWEVMTFEEASKRDLISTLRDASKSFAPLFRAIEEEANANGFTWDPQSQIAKNDFYSTYRFASLMKEREKQLASNSLPESALIASKESVSANLSERAPLEDQWKLQKNVVEVSRMENKSFDVSKLLSMQPGTWSELTLGADGELLFYRLVKTIAPSKDITDVAMSVQKLLSNEAKSELMAKLMDQIVAAKAISLILIESPSGNEQISEAEAPKES